MVACLVGPGPEEDILLLDIEFLMSSFGEGLFALCTKRCLVEGGDATPSSQPVMSLAATCVVRHGHNRETLQRPGEIVCFALDACDGRLPACYKHSSIHKASADRPLGKDNCQVLVISSGQTQQMNEVWRYGRPCAELGSVVSAWAEGLAEEAWEEAQFGEPRVW